MALPSDTQYLCKTCQCRKEQKFQHRQSKSHPQRELDEISGTYGLDLWGETGRYQGADQNADVATGAIGKGMERFAGRRTFFPISKTIRSWRT